MSKRYETIGYILAFLAVFAFLLGWKIFSNRERPEDIAEYQRRLNITADNVLVPVLSDNADDSLRIFAVNVAHTPPFKNRFIGYGVYIGQGLVLTAAHVVGDWPAYSPPHVFIAGQDLSARILKQGSFEHTDLALLLVDQERLPMSLRLRRSPQCKELLRVGLNVIVVYPERTTRSKIISSRLIPFQYRSRFPTLITEPQGSGSGVYDAEKKCLIGIMSAKVTKFSYQAENGKMSITGDGFAGYFVPVSKGSTFLPSIGVH